MKKKSRKTHQTQELPNYKKIWGLHPSPHQKQKIWGLHPLPKTKKKFGFQFRKDMGNRVLT